MTANLRSSFRAILAAAMLALTSGFGMAQGARQSKDWLAEGFKNPPPEARMRMFWRIFGPAWQKEEIDYQLGLLKQAGVGGVMAFFFYAVALDDPAKGIKNEALLSAKNLEMLGYAAKKAKSLGLRFGVAGAIRVARARTACHSAMTHRIRAGACRGE